MEIYQIVAQNVIRLRKALGLSQLKLATQAEITTGMLLDIEHARGNPNLATLSKLADALDVPLYILFDEAEKQAFPPSPMKGLVALLEKSLEEEKLEDGTAEI